MVADAPARRAIAVGEAGSASCAWKTGALDIGGTQIAGAGGAAAALPVPLAERDAVAVADRPRLADVAAAAAFAIAGLVILARSAANLRALAIAAGLGAAAAAAARATVGIVGLDGDALAAARLLRGLALLLALLPGFRLGISIGEVRRGNKATKQRYGSAA